MIRILFGIFVGLHGMVHLLYFGQSARYFELQPGMLWPDGSWILSRALGAGSVRMVASALLVLAAAGLIASGIGIVAGQSWVHGLVVGAAIFSIVTFLILWDGGAAHLDTQGAVGILLDLLILAAVLIFRWPGLQR